MNKENQIYMYIDNNKLDIDKVAEEFSSYLWRIIFNSGIKENDSIREIISDTYLMLWKNQEKLILSAPLAPYLVGITKNLIKNYFGKNYKKFEINNIEDEENLIFENSDISLNIERKEISEKILKILEKIGEEEKEIFLDFYFEGRKIKEISIKHNFSEAKIKTKLHRLRKKIRKELLKGGYSIYE